MHEGLKLEILTNQNKFVLHACKFYPEFSSHRISRFAWGEGSSEQSEGVTLTNLRLARDPRRVCACRIYVQGVVCGHACRRSVGHIKTGPRVTYLHGINEIDRESTSRSISTVDAVRSSTVDFTQTKKDSQINRKELSITEKESPTKILENQKHKGVKNLI